MAWVLDEHLHALVAKDRPYKCELCQMRFTQSSSLNRHKKIHTGGFTSLHRPEPILYPHFQDKLSIGYRATRSLPPLSFIPSIIIDLYDFVQRNTDAPCWSRIDPTNAGSAFWDSPRNRVWAGTEKYTPVGPYSHPADLCVTFILEAERH